MAIPVSWTLRKGQKIVVVIPVGMSSYILTIWAVYRAYVSPLAVSQSVERIGSLLYRINYLLSRPFPLRTPKMRDALMGIDSRLLVDARNSHVCHGYLRDLSILRRLPHRSFARFSRLLAHGA
jgi:hypothetical protein